MCARSGSNPAVPIRFREFPMARPSSFATSKVEEWRSIDLANLRRWRMLTPGMVARTGTIPGIYWDTPRGREQLGVVAGSKSVWFIKRHDGQLYRLAVPYVFTPTRFGGWRAWFQCPGCRRGCRVLYGTNSLRCRKCRGLKYEFSISNISLPPARSGLQDQASPRKGWQLGRPAAAKAALHALAHVPSARAPGRQAGAGGLGRHVGRR